MRVLMRADASREIGIGHVMRCLTLAQGLRGASAHVEFVCSELEGNINARVAAAGFPVHAREPADGRWDWFVVDHYDLDERFERRLRDRARRILVIDDLADRAHDCDLLLDQNLYPDMDTRYSARVPAGARTLLGPSFALLRAEFAEVRERVRTPVALTRILVSFGGSDPTDETSKTLEALSALRLGEIRVDVLVGAANPRREQLASRVARMAGCRLLEPTDQMATLMSTADLIVGAGGTTSWERCCLGRPAITIAVADHQVAISQSLADRGCQQFLGFHAAVSVESLREALRAALDDFSPLARAGALGRDLVDGRGARRVIDAMEST